MSCSEIHFAREKVSRPFVKLDRRKNECVRTHDENLMVSYRRDENTIFLFI